MKVERLYTITLYLLNHGRTSAKELAKYFEVSIRTTKGHRFSLYFRYSYYCNQWRNREFYEISKNFKLDKLFASVNDYFNIKMALKGLVSPTDNSKVKHTLEKIVHVSKSNDNNLILHFSILRECD